MAGTSLIGAYLDQLRAQLPRRADTDDVIAEVEDHLHSIVEAHLSLGLSEEAATAHAVGAFGSAELVARAFAQQQGDTAAVPTTFTTYAGVAALLGGLVLGLVLTIASVTDLDVGPGSAWFGLSVNVGALLTIIGLVGVHVRHRALYGFGGRIGRLLVPISVVGLVVSAATWFAPGYLVFLTATIIGLVALGVEVWRGGVIARPALILLAAGVAGIPAMTLVSNEQVSTTVPSALAGVAVAAAMGAGLVWLGHGLWRERVDLGISGGRPTPTT